MVDVRRLYRRWFLKRLAWLLPGIAISIAAGARVLADGAQSTWTFIPSAAIVAGALLLIATMLVRCAQVVRVAASGRRAKARTLRRVLGPYRELTMAGVAAVLSLAAIPLLFRGPSPLPEVEVLRPTLSRAIPTPESVAAPVVAEPPAPAPIAAERPPVPELPPLEDDPPSLPPPLPAPVARAQEPPPAPAREERDVPQHPEVTDFTRSLALAPMKPTLDRGGLPGDADLETLPLPELTLDFTIVPDSGDWRGSIYEASFELPLDRNESLRVTYFAAALNNEMGESLEATLTWHRLSLEYDRKVAGYTREATFDLSLRFGATVDRIAAHDAGFALVDTPRISPWIGFETAVWDPSGFGLVVQGGYAVAARVTRATATTADVRVMFRVDLSEKSTIFLGYRLTSVRLHDHGHESGLVREELDQTFSGPMAGLALRF